MRISAILFLLLGVLAPLSAQTTSPQVGTPVVFGCATGGWVTFKTTIPEGQSFLGIRLLSPKGDRTLAACPPVRWLQEGVSWKPEADKAGDGFYNALAFTNDPKADGWPTIPFAPTSEANAVRSITFTSSALAPVTTATITLITSTTDPANTAGALDANAAGDTIESITIGETAYPINKSCMALAGYTAGADGRVMKYSAVPITLPIKPATRYTITIKSAPFAQRSATHMINGLFIPSTFKELLERERVENAGISIPKYERIEYVYNSGRRNITDPDMNDPEAATGKSLRMVAEKKTSGTIADAYIYPPYPGRYRFTFRLKIDDNHGETTVASLNPGFPGIRNPTVNIKASDFTEAGKYQDFTVEGIAPESVFGAYLVNFNAAPGRTLWWDSVKYALVEPYSDQRVIDEWYPSFTAGQTVTRGKGEEGLRTEVFAGSLYESTGIPAALTLLGKKAPRNPAAPGDMRFYQAPEPRKPGEWRESLFIDHGQVKDRVPGFPKTAEEFARLDLIILANVPGRAPLAPARLLLRDWVKTAGGGLFLTGGMTALGKGYLDGSALEALLPVELSGVNDVKPAKDGRLVVKDPALANLLGGATLSTRFYQAVKVKPDAHVLIETADGVPLLVEWSCGAGHVAVWTSLPLGGVPEGQTAWWKSDKWPALLAEVLQRIAGK
ncbi:MAG TPA: hypothetical protein VGM23_16750 [Armatimonadota bacterium]|jgi:uncharacterized membrane protein